MQSAGEPKVKRTSRRPRRLAALLVGGATAVGLITLLAFSRNWTGEPRYISDGTDKPCAFELPYIEGKSAIIKAGAALAAGDATRAVNLIDEAAAVVERYKGLFPDRGTSYIRHDEGNPLDGPAAESGDKAAEARVKTIELEHELWDYRGACGFATEKGWTPTPRSP